MDINRLLNRFDTATIKKTDVKTTIRHMAAALQGFAEEEAPIRVALSLLEGLRQDPMLPFKHCRGHTSLLQHFLACSRSLGLRLNKETH